MSAISISLAIGLVASSASATTVFFDDFEGNLGAWEGNGSGHTGVIVSDPLDASNNVLSFTSISSGGDIFTSATFSSPQNQYRISFDYLGTPGLGGVANNLGGFIGYSQDFPGTHNWIAGTSSNSGAADSLVDDGTWQHVQIDFVAGFSPFHLLVEDYSGSGGIAGDVYFDNITLVAIPEPSTALLLGFGIVVLGAMSRRL
jgi:hypothetical protein